jgi:hypothetical protein
MPEPGEETCKCRHDERRRRGELRTLTGSHALHVENDGQHQHTDQAEERVVLAEQAAERSEQGSEAEGA